MRDTRMHGSTGGAGEGVFYGNRFTASLGKPKRLEPGFAHGLLPHQLPTQSDGVFRPYNWPQKTDPIVNSRRWGECGSSAASKSRQTPVQVLVVEQGQLHPSCFRRACEVKGEG